MSHDHRDHDHDHARETTAAVSKRREAKLRVAMWLTVAIVAAQVVFGFIAHSLGLIADAGHNLTDVAAVAASMVALRLTRRPANQQRSFGYHRATVIAAQANATSILVVTALVTYEAIRRLLNPAPVNGSIVIAVALGGAACNLAAVVVLRDSHARHGPPRRNGHDLNMRSTALHMAGDTAASLGVASAGAVIATTGNWYWLDPAISIAVGVLIAFQAWKLLRQTVDVLLESTPDDLDTDALASAIAGVAGIEEVHDLHVWSLASDIRALSAHLLLEGHPTLEQAQVIGYAAKAVISAPFSISHATFELECESCRDDGSWCTIT